MSDDEHNEDEILSGMNADQLHQLEGRLQAEKKRRGSSETPEQFERKVRRSSDAEFQKLMNDITDWR